MKMDIYVKSLAIVVQVGVKDWRISLTSGWHLNDVLIATIGGNLGVASLGHLNDRINESSFM